MPFKTIIDLDEQLIVEPSDLVIIADPEEPTPGSLQAFKATIQALATSVFSLGQGVVLRVQSLQTQYWLKTLAPGTIQISSEGRYGTLSSSEAYDAIKVGDKIDLIGVSGPLEVYEKVQPSPPVIMFTVPAEGLIPGDLGYFYGPPSYRSFKESGEVDTYDSVVSFNKKNGFVYANKVVATTIALPYGGEDELVIEGVVLADGLSVGVDYKKEGTLAAKEIITEDLYFYDTATVSQIVTETLPAIDIAPTTGQCSFPGSTMFVSLSLSDQIFSGTPYRISFDQVSPIIHNRIVLQPGDTRLFLVQPGIYIVNVAVQYAPTQLGTLPNYSKVETWIKGQYGSGAEKYIARDYQSFKDLMGAGVVVVSSMSAMFEIPATGLQYKLHVGGIAYIGSIPWGYLSGKSTIGIAQLNGRLT